MYPRVPIDQLWKLIPCLRSSICYLDIETLGCDPARGRIIAVALADGTDRVDTYIRGVDSDLRLKNIIRKIQSKETIVTWNGTKFDLPFLIEQCGLKMQHIHFDLGYLCKRVGLKPHMKHAEMEIGIDRLDLKWMDGAYVGRLWGLCLETDDNEYVDLLRQYNVLDATNLEFLLCEYYNRLTDTFNSGYHISRPLYNQIDRGFDKYKNEVMNVKRKKIGVTKKIS